MIADKGDDADEYRAALEAKGIKSCIPPRKGLKAATEFCKAQYKQRDKIENIFSGRKTGSAFPPDMAAEPMSSLPQLPSQNLHMVGSMGPEPSKWVSRGGEIYV